MKLIPELPLLRRELTELANRRRTYIVRVIGAVVILFFVFVAYQQAIIMRRQMFGFSAMGGGINQSLGIGGDIFAQITPTLFYAIQLLMPAFCCACVTAEKENNTIGTLLLTKLSPGTIVMEKLGSRLVPMLTLLLLTFPVLAHVFTMGGVDTDLLLGTIWLLLCECLLFASIAIMCSSWFTTTVTAFIWSYVLIGCLAAMTLSLGYATFVPSTIWRTAFSGAQAWGLSRAQLQIMNTMGMGPGGAGAAAFTWLTLVYRSAPSLILTAVFLFVARLVLVRRAFASQSSVLLRVFKKVDAFFKELNERTTGGIELVADSNRMPDNDPVAWRERNKKSLGKARYLFRILVMLELPTFLVCMVAATSSARSMFQGLYILQALIWMLAVLVVAVKGATLFSSERAKQTIEPLLASPMTAVEMLSQKITGMRRLLIVLAIPILTVNLTHFLLHVDLDSLRALSPAFLRPLCYMFLSVFCVFLLLTLVAWLSAGIGLKIHSQTKAVLAAVTVIAIWALVPLIAREFYTDDPLARDSIMTLSPFSPVAAVEEYLVEGSNFEKYGAQRNPQPRIVWCAISIIVYSCALLITMLGVRLLSPRLLNRLENPRKYATISTPPTRVPAMEGSQL